MGFICYDSSCTGVIDKVLRAVVKKLESVFLLDIDISFELSF